MSRWRVSMCERESVAPLRQALMRPLRSDSFRRYSSISAAFVCVSCRWNVQIHTQAASPDMHTPGRPG